MKTDQQWLKKSSKTLKDWGDDMVLFENMTNEQLTKIYLDLKNDSNKSYMAIRRFDQLNQFLSKNNIALKIE